MAVNGEIELTWGDGEYKFNVAKLKLIFELEEKCNAGVAEIFNRLTKGQWKFNDVRETLRLGLIGGGKPPDEAMRIINRYCDERPWAESVLPAQAIIMAAMVGVPGDELGKKVKAERAKENQSSEKMADMSAPLSMASELPSNSTHDK